MNSNHQLVTSYYNSHRSELLTFVSSRLPGEGAEAEDIVQEVFVRLLSTDKLLSEVTLQGLVHTISRRMIIDYYRRHRAYEPLEHFIRQPGSNADSALSVLSVREIVEGMERALTRLPESCREVYRLHIYGGMKVSEISSQLGEGYKTVEHRLGTARKAMRQYLRNYA